MVIFALSGTGCMGIMTSLCVSGSFCSPSAACRTEFPLPGTFRNFVANPFRGHFHFILCKGHQQIQKHAFDETGGVDILRHNTIKYTYVSNNIQGCSEMNMILFWNTLDNIESSANIFLMASFFINQRLPVNSLSASLLTSTTAMPIFLHSSQG